MLIDLKTACQRPLRLGFNLEPKWWQVKDEGEQVLGLDGPLKVQMVISKAGDGYVVEGKLSGRITLKCGRCIEPYHSDMQSDFRISLVRTSGDRGLDELELTADDMWTDFISGDQLDLDHIIRGQIYLTLPMKNLCHENCAGLCPECGCNLNLEVCDCRPKRGYSAFSKLAAINLKKH